MVCKKCGYQNSSDAVFCSGCGTKLAPPQRQFCTQCGAQIPEGAKFCDRCGMSLTGRKRKLPVIAIACGGLAALIAVIGIAVGISSLGKEKPKPQPSVQVTEAPAREEETKTASQQKNYMQSTGSQIRTDGGMEAFCDANEAFGLPIARNQVRKIVFLNTQESAPRNAYDLSEAQDMSVVAWMGEYNDLYIAAEGLIIAPENCQGMFANYTALEEIRFNGCFDTSEVTDMSGMFMGCGAAELDLSGFDTSRVTSMAWMFSHVNLRELDVSGFNTRNVTDMQGMFSWTPLLEKLDLRGLNTSSVTDMSNMFAYCICLQKLDLRSLDTSKVTDMHNMFFNCLELETLDVSSFDTASVKNMDSMFYSCSALKMLDLSSFNTRNVTDMGNMFYCCSGLESLNTGSFVTPVVTDMNNMFCYMGADYLDLRGFDFRNVTDASFMFYACEDLVRVDISSFNLPADADTTLMFEYCPAFQETEPATTAPAATTAPQVSAYEPSGHRSEVQISVGGTVSYPWIFDEPVTDCTGFTLHYQITRINYGKVEGTYVVYRKTMAGTWERVGKFDVKGQEEVTATFEFSQPISFTELAIAAPSGRKFSFSSRNWYDNWQFRN